MVVITSEHRQLVIVSFSFLIPQAGSALLEPAFGVDVVEVGLMVGVPEVDLVDICDIHDRLQPFSELHKTQDSLKVVVEGGKLELKACLIHLILIIIFPL